MLKPAMHAKSPHILIVEDDPDDVLLLQCVLRRIGMSSGVSIEFRSVDNGIDALLRISRDELLGHLPSAVILDLNMPRLDGMGLLKAVRCSFGLRDLPIFVLTTTATESIHDAALSLGATRIFVKPNSMGELTTIVSEVLDIVQLAGPRRTKTFQRAPRSVETLGVWH